MLLRKYLLGGKIISYEQPGFDRIAVLTVSCYDEMGFPTVKKIVCEIMGKYANLILLDADGKIITALKIIDFAASTVRQVLPGLHYTFPEQQTKLSVLDTDRALFIQKYSEFPKDKPAESATAIAVTIPPTSL